MPLLSNSMPYLDNLASGLASAAIGGGLAKMMTKRRSDETEEDYNRRVSMNTATGVFGGGAVGAGIPSALSALSGFAPKPFTERLMENPVGTVVDPLLDNTVGRIGVLAPAGGIVGGWASGRMAQKDFSSQMAAAEKALESSQSGLQHAQNLHLNNEVPNGTPETERVFNDATKQHNEAQAKVKSLSEAAPGAVRKGRLGGGAAGTALGFLVDHFFASKI